MSIPIKEIRELSEKFKCCIDCSDCSFIRDCKHLDEENFRYRPLSSLETDEEVSEETSNLSKFIIFPALKLKSEEKRKKLLELFLAIEHFNTYAKLCNAKTLAEYLNIPIINIRKRLAFLRNKEVIQIRKSGKYNIIEFFDKNKDKNLRRKELLAFFMEEYKNMFSNKPYIESIDISVMKNFIKKTELTMDQIRILIKEYLKLNNKFLKDTGYRFRNFPAHINGILISKPDLINVNNKSISSITNGQLSDYLEGKKNGKWNGLESWARTYEEALKKL